MIGTRSIVVCLTFVSCATTVSVFRRTCNETNECTRLSVERAQSFEVAVASEPAAVRLDVEALPGALFDRSRSAVYVAAPSLTALDLRTGAPLWSMPEVKGTLGRAGRWLVSTSVTPPLLDARVQFVNPNAVPRTAVTCALKLPVPKGANVLSLTPFDRGGVPHVMWSSNLYWKAGVAPPASFDAEREAATKCGAVSIDPSTCATRDVPADQLVVPGAPVVCPLYWVPALTASQPKPHVGLDATWLHTAFVTEHVDTCTRRVRQVLEARSADSTLLWSKVIEERLDHCGPP